MIKLIFNIVAKIVCQYSAILLNLLVRSIAEKMLLLPIP